MSMSVASRSSGAGSRVRKTRQFPWRDAGSVSIPSRVVIAGRELPSPARAYCSLCRGAPDIDMTKVEAVLCDDHTGEGFRSIANVIS